MGATSLHITKFMNSEKKCESGFAMLNKCGCVPDEGLAQLFSDRINQSIMIINKSNISIWS